MKKHFKDKVVIITGSSMGIGRELAVLLGSFGAKIIINARGEEQLYDCEKVLRDNGVEVLAVAGDITIESHRINLIEQTILKFQKIDVLINNAGVSMRGKVEELSSTLIQSIYNINTIAPLSLSQLALPHLKKTNGSIVFVSSLAGLRGLPFLSLYSSSKMALQAIGESLRIEHKADNIHVGIMYVGYTEIQAGKKTMGPRGESIALGERKGLMVSTTFRVASEIAKMIKNRKNSSMLGLSAKVYFLLVNFFPRLFDFLLTRSYNRIKKIYK